VSDDANSVEQSTAEAVLQYLAEQFTDDPSGIEIHSNRNRHGLTLELSVAPNDMGKVIGRKGRTAQAIRTVTRAAGARDGVDVRVDIVD
jgi:uncharacterized protein